MIRSMTGFGRGAGRFARARIEAEIKTVNHRFYELSSRLPSSISFLEDKIRNYINTKIKRGRVNLSITMEDTGRLQRSLAINKDLAKKYCRILNDLKKELNIAGGISLDHILSLPDIMTGSSAQVEAEKIWPGIKTALDNALAKLLKSREVEGAALCRDLTARINRIGRLTKNIEGRSPAVVANYKKNLMDRIRQISGSVNLDAGRIETEVALFAKNCDISEEVLRLSAHIRNFKAVLGAAEAVGRQLDFIAQELFREANTIGSKAQDIKISRRVIQIKEQIENIREQVQNVE